MMEAEPGDAAARVTLTELQNRALLAGIPSAKVRAAINDPESPKESLLSLLLDQLHSQYVSVASNLAESDEWKVLSMVPPQPNARRDLSLEPHLQQRLRRCTESDDFKDFELAVLQELAVSVGADRRAVAEVVDAEPDESYSDRTAHVNAIKRKLANMVLNSQALLQQSVIETRALPSGWGGDKETRADVMASYQLSAVATADEELEWLMEQQKLASAEANEETHRIRNHRHFELLDKIRAATSARDTVVMLQELSRQQTLLDVEGLRTFAKAIGLQSAEEGAPAYGSEVKPKTQADDEETERKKLLAEIHHEFPMPVARNTGSFGVVKLVSGLDLEERAISTSSDAHVPTIEHDGSNPFAADIDEIERRYDAERKLLQKYGSSHGPPRSQPVTPSVIEAYLSNHSHFICTKGFAQNISQLSSGRGLRVHIYGRAIQVHEDAVQMERYGSYMHMDASGVFFGKRSLTPEWEIIARVDDAEDYIRDRLSELIQKKVGANIEEQEADLDKELRLLTVHELRQRARTEGIPEQDLAGTSPATFLDKGWRSVDVFFKNITTGTYLRGDPRDAHVTYEHKRERTSEYGAIGSDHSRKEIYKERNYLTLGLKQDPGMADQNIWRCEWAAPQSGIMEWIEKLEVLGQHGQNQDVIRYHFQMLLQRDVLGVKAVDDLGGLVEEEEGRLSVEAGSDDRQLVILGFSWNVLSEWANLLSESAQKIYCDAMHRIAMEIEPEDFSSDLVNGGYAELMSGSRVMLASVERNPVSDDDIEKERIIGLLVEGNYTSLLAEMKGGVETAYQDATDDFESIHAMSKWTVEEAVEWVARIVGMQRQAKKELRSRIETERQQGYTIHSMNFLALRRVIDGLVEYSSHSGVWDTRRAVHTLVHHRHNRMALEQKKRADVTQWLEQEDLASLRIRAKNGNIEKEKWTHGDVFYEQGPLRSWLTQRGVIHVDGPSLESVELGRAASTLAKQRYEDYLRRLVARASEKLTYLHSNSPVEHEVISWQSFRPQQTADFTEQDTSWRLCWDDSCVLDGPAVSVEGVVEIQQHEWANPPASHVDDNGAAEREANTVGEMAKQLADTAANAQSEVTHVKTTGVRTIQEVRHHDGDNIFGSPSKFKIQLSAHGESRSDVCTMSTAGDVVSICIVPTSFDLLRDLHERKYDWLLARWQKAIDASFENNPELPRTVVGSQVLKEVLKRQVERDAYHRRPMRVALYDDLILQIAKVERTRLSLIGGNHVEQEELRKLWRERFRQEILSELASLEQRWADRTFGPRGPQSVSTSFTVDTFPRVEWRDWWTETSAPKIKQTFNESVTIRSEWKVDKGLARMLVDAGISPEVSLEERWDVVLRELILSSQDSYAALELKREAVRDSPELAKDTMKYIGPRTELHEIRPQLSHLETYYEMRACYRSGHRQDIDLRTAPLRRIDFVADVVRNTMIIMDTGLGLAQREIEVVLGNLLKRTEEDSENQAENDSARYLSFRRDMSVRSNFVSDPYASLIGHVNLGFWSLFGVAEKVTVVTVDWEKKEQMFWTLPKPPATDEEAIRMKSLVVNGAKTRDLPPDYPQRDLIAKDIGRGTKIILNLQETEKDLFADGLVRLESFLERQSCFARFPICLWEMDKSPPFVEVHLADTRCTCRICMDSKVVDAASKMSLLQMWKLIDEHNDKLTHLNRTENQARDTSVSRGCTPLMGGTAVRMGLRDLDRNWPRKKLLAALDRRGFQFEERSRYSFGDRYKLVKLSRAKRKIDIIARGNRTAQSRICQTAADVVVLLLWSVPVVIFLAVAVGDLRDIQNLDKFLIASVQILLGVIGCRLESYGTKVALVSLVILWGLSIWGLKAKRRNTTDAVRHGSRKLPGERRVVAFSNRPVVVHTIVRSSVPFKELDLTWYRLTDQHRSFSGFLLTFLGRDMQHVFPRQDSEFPRPPRGKGLRARIFRACFPLATSNAFGSFMGICTTIEAAGMAGRTMGVNLYGLNLDSMYEIGGVMWYMHLNFVLESLIKIGGLGASYYFNGDAKWNNRLDFLLAYVWYVEIAWWVFDISAGDIKSITILRLLPVCQMVRNQIIRHASFETLEHTETRQHMKNAFFGEDHVYQNRRHQLNLLLKVFPHPHFSRLFRSARGQPQNPACCGRRRDDRDWGIGINWMTWFAVELEAFLLHCRLYFRPNLFSCTFLRRKPKQVAWYDGWPIEVVRKPLTFLSRHDKFFVRLFGRRVRPVLAHMETKVSLDETILRKQREWDMESAINAVQLNPQSDEKLARLHRVAMSQPNQGVPVQEWGLRGKGAQANGIVLDYETRKVYVDGSREMYEAMDEETLRNLCTNSKIPTSVKRKGNSATDLIRDLTKSELVARLAKKSEETRRVIRPFASRAQFCVAHKPDEDRKLHFQQCPLCDDASVPNYGDRSDGIARFCAKHKNQDHVDVRKKCCEMEDCSELAEYGHLCVHPCPFSLANACGGHRRWYYETKVTAQIVSHVDEDWRAGHFRCEAKLKSDPTIWDATAPVRLDKEEAWAPYAMFWTLVLIFTGSVAALFWMTFSNWSSVQCVPESCDLYQCGSMTGGLENSTTATSSTATSSTAFAGPMPNQTNAGTVTTSGANANQSETPLVGSNVTQVSVQSDSDAGSTDNSVSNTVGGGSSTDYQCSRPNPRQIAAKFVPLSYEGLDPWRCESQLTGGAFDLSAVDEELRIGNFSVEGVACSSGYVGTPVVSTCTNHDEVYILVGCVAKACNRWWNWWWVVGAMYLLRVAVLAAYHLRSHSLTFAQEMHSLLRHVHIGWIYSEMFSNSLHSAAQVTQQITGASSAFGSSTSTSIFDHLWPHIRMIISYLQLLAMLPIVLQWDHGHYFPFVASVQSVCAKLLDPFAIIECLLPEYGSAPRVLFPVLFLAFAACWMIWDGFTLRHEHVATRRSVQRLLGVKSPEPPMLSLADMDEMFEAFKRLHRSFPKVQARANKFWVSRTPCAKGQVVIILDAEAWKAVHDSDGADARQPAQILLKHALEEIRDSFFTERDRAMRGDNKRAHVWGKHLGLRTVFDVNKSSGPTPPSYLVTFHLLLPGLRERVRSNNELVARDKHFLFMSRAERLARVQEYEKQNVARVRHGLMRHGYTLLIGTWALPKIHAIATALVVEHSQSARNRVTRRMSAFELERLDKDTGTLVNDTSRLCLEVHVYQAEAEKTREVVYKTILRLIIDMMDPETGLRARPRGQVDDDFETWNANWARREQEDRIWRYKRDAVNHFLRLHKRRLLRVPTGSAHAACKTYRISHYQIVAAWQALFVDDLCERDVTLKSLFAALDAAHVDILDTEQGYHMLNEDYHKSLRLNTRAESARMRLGQEDDYKGNLVAGQTGYQIFKRINSDWEVQQAKRAAIQAEADEMKEFEKFKLRKLRPYKPRGFRVFAVLSDAFGRIKAFESIQEDKSTFPEQLEQDVTPPPPIEYRLKGMYYYSKHILSALHRHADLDVDQQMLQKRLDDFRLRCWREAQVVAQNRCTEMAYFIFIPLATLAGRIVADNHTWVPPPTGQGGDMQSRLMSAAGLGLMAVVCLLLFSILPVQIKHDVPHQVWMYVGSALLVVLIGVAMSDDNERFHESFDMYTSAGVRYIPLFYSLGIPLAIAAQLFHFRRELTYDESEIDFFEWQTMVRKLRKTGHLDVNKPPEQALDKFLRRGFRNLLNTRVSRRRALGLSTTITEQQVHAVCASRESWGSWFDTIHDVEPVASLDLSWLWWRLSIPIILVALWGLWAWLMRELRFVTLDDVVIETWSTEWLVRAGLDWTPAMLVVATAVIVWIAAELKWASFLPDAETHAFVARNRFIQAQFSGITGSFKIDKFWYEALDYLRKLMMTVGLCLFNPGSTEQLFAATMASCVFLCCILWFEPYASNPLNRTKIACEMVILLVVLSAVAARVSLSASANQSSDECVLAVGRGEFSLQVWSTYLEWMLFRGLLLLLFILMLILEFKHIERAMYEVTVQIAHLLRVLGFTYFKNVEESIELDIDEIEEGSDDDDYDDDYDEQEVSHVFEREREAAHPDAEIQDKHRTSTTTQPDVADTEATAIKLQRWWRGARARRTLQELTQQQIDVGVDRVTLGIAILAGASASLLLTFALWLVASLSQLDDDSRCQCAQDGDQPLSAWPTIGFAYFLAGMWFLGGWLGASFSYYRKGTWLPHINLATQRQRDRAERRARKNRALRETDYMDAQSQAETLNPLTDFEPEPESERKTEPEQEPEPEPEPDGGN